MRNVCFELSKFLRLILPTNVSNLQSHLSKYNSWGIITCTRSNVIKKYHPTPKVPRNTHVTYQCYNMVKSVPIEWRTHTYIASRRSWLLCLDDQNKSSKLSIKNPKWVKYVNGIATRHGVISNKPFGFFYEANHWCGLLYAPYMSFIYVAKCYYHILI